MAVYSIKTDGDQRVLEVTEQFKVFDLVTITLEDGQTINGEIIYIREEEIYVTGPYGPIETFKLHEILNITSWYTTEGWEYKPKKA